MKTILQGDHPTLETVAGRYGEIIIVGEKAMMMRLTVQPNIPTPPHSHPHEQMGILLEGEGPLYIGDEVKEICKGTSFYVPPNSPHNFDAIMRSTLLCAHHRLKLTRARKNFGVISMITPRSSRLPNIVVGYCAQ